MNKINKLLFPYVLIIPIGEKQNQFFVLNTQACAHNHPYGTYAYENRLTAEEIGQLMGGN